MWCKEYLIVKRCKQKERLPRVSLAVVFFFVLAADLLHSPKVATCSFVSVSEEAWRGWLRGLVVVFLLSHVGCCGAFEFRQSFLEQSSAVLCIVPCYRRGLVADLEFSDVGQGHGTRVQFRWVWDPRTSSRCVVGFVNAEWLASWCGRGDVEMWSAWWSSCRLDSHLRSTLRTGRKRMGLGLWALAHCPLLLPYIHFVHICGGTLFFYNVYHTTRSA